MNIRAFSLALASMFLFSIPTFAACSVVLAPRDIDRPVASTTNTESEMILNGADYTDWETIAETSSLAPTSGGFEMVPSYYVDGNGKTYPPEQYSACKSAAVELDSIDPLNLGAGAALALGIFGAAFLGRGYLPVFSIPGEGDGGGEPAPSDAPADHADESEPGTDSQPGDGADGNDNADEAGTESDD